MSAVEIDSPTELEGQNLQALLELQRSKFRAEGEVTYATRVDRLKRLKALIIEKKRSSRPRPNANMAVNVPTNSACSLSLPPRSKRSTIPLSTSDSG